MAHNSEDGRMVLLKTICCEDMPSNYHDRFLVIDDTVYHLGASLKDLGKKLFVLSKLNVPVKKLIC